MNKGTYVDGFVIPIPRRNAAAYKKMAREGLQLWMRFGALDYKECVLDNVRLDPGIKMTFPKLAKAKPNETVWFSFIVYRSRAHRDAVNKKVMAHLSKKYGKDHEQNLFKMPFDMNRMTSGGFKVQVGV